MATISTSGAYPATNKQDGGTVIMGGNIEVSGVITVSKSSVDMGRIKGEPYGSKVVEHDGAGLATDSQWGAVPAIAGSGGTFAYQPTNSDPQFLIRGYATKINNSASTTIQIPGTDFGSSRYDGIAGRISNVAAGSGAGTVIDVMAKPSTSIHPERTKGGDAGLTYTYAAPSGNGAITSSGDRNAIGPHNANQVPLNYMDGSATPKSDEYKSRFTNE